MRPAKGYAPYAARGSRVLGSILVSPNRHGLVGDLKTGELAGGRAPRNRLIANIPLHPLGNRRPETVEFGGLALGDQLHIAIVQIAYKPSHYKALRQMLHRPPKADALDPAAV